jgi:hypothetical protein
MRDENTSARVAPFRTFVSEKEGMIEEEVIRRNLFTMTLV